MDIKIFFDRVDEACFEMLNDPNCIFHQLHVHLDKFPSWKIADIALIGISEERGSVYNMGIERSANEIRKKLYKLKKGPHGYKVVDLGNLRNGLKLEDTYERVREVCEILLQNNVIPLLIGGSHDIDYGQYAAYEKFEKFISVVNIDAILDVESNVSVGQNKHHSHRILMHEPNYLFNFSNIGYQSFLNDQEMLAILEKLNFENYRIGHAKGKIDEMEPVIRNADMISFDITAVRMSDAPGNPNVTPFGFTGEEACQLAWYAGLNNKLSSFGVYEYNPEEDIKGQTASLVATICWYFMEGFYNRKSDLDFYSDSYIKFIVSSENSVHKITFYKNKLTEMWWMEVPFPDDKDLKKQRVSVVPCSYGDYESALKGELPLRWIQAHAKLI